MPGPSTSRTSMPTRRRPRRCASASPPIAAATRPPPSRRSPSPPRTAAPAPSGSSATCMPRATGWRRTTTPPSSCSATLPPTPPRTASGRRDQPTPFVTSAWAKLGAFFRKGIPNSDVKADPSRAREYFWRAAYFGDADAQLNLAAMFYNGEGGGRDLIQAAKWANLAADKGNPAAKDLLDRDRAGTHPRPSQEGRQARQPAPGGAMGQARRRLRQRRGAGALRPHPVRRRRQGTASRSRG